MKIAIVAPGRPSWVDLDVKILDTLGETAFIDSLKAGFRSRFNNLLNLSRADICYFWFGSLRHLPYVLFAKILGKRIAIVAGGYDVNRLESIRYGTSNDRGLKLWLRKLIFFCAHDILAVSEFTRRSAIHNLNLNETRIRVTPLAFQQPADTTLKPWSEWAPQVVFLLSAQDDMFLVKGVDRIPELCRELPDIQFKLVGNLGPMARNALSEARLTNLKLVGFLPFQGPEFVKILNETRIVCLPSRLESFGAALIDGALRGCIPVAFNVGAIPEVIDGVGVIVECEEVSEMVSVIKSTIYRTDVNVTALREQVLQKFSFANRQKVLSTVVLSQKEQNAQ